MIVAILKADVDLLWFGGIGTFVRGAEETDAAAGDRANDGIRITGPEIRAKVVGEGANLAVTQLGRLGYARRGGRIDTDAIDNSAGVNCSDLEVNLKIALNASVAAHRLSVEQRNELLLAAADDVAALCLRNNYLQSLALSLAGPASQTALSDYRGLLENLEVRAVLDPVADVLPSTRQLDERAAAGTGLLRPELAVLMGHVKIALRQDLLASRALDDAYLGNELFAYFPPRLAESQHDAIAAHRLRREIVGTVLANAMVNRGGPTFVANLMAATSADAGSVARAYAATRDSFSLTDLHRRLDGLDGLVAADIQLGLYAEVQKLLEHQTLWFLRNESFADGLAELVARYALGVGDLSRNLADLLPPALAARLARRAASLQAAGVPFDLPALGLGGEAVLAAGHSGVTVVDAARAFFFIVDFFGLADLMEEATALNPGDRFDHLALDRALANLLRAERDLAVDVLAAGTGVIADRSAAWQASGREAIERTRRAVRELTAGQPSVSKLAVAAGLMSDLASGR